MTPDARWWITFGCLFLFAAIAILSFIKAMNTNYVYYRDFNPIIDVPLNWTVNP